MLKVLEAADKGLLRGLDGLAEREESKRVRKLVFVSQTGASCCPPSQPM